MIVSDIRQKLLLFMYLENMTQKELAKELNYDYSHFNDIMCGRYEPSNRLNREAEALFKRYKRTEFLDFKGRL